MMPSTANVTLSKRRRFQPPITSFFSSTPSDSTDSHACHVSHNHYSAATFSAHPVVSAKVQSNLLNVGMRVRKSVAEGYKTELKKLSAPPPVISAPEPQNVRVVRPHSSTSYAELAPFSGISKHSRDMPNDRSYAINPNQFVVDDDGDAFSLPPSSQESTSSYITSSSLSQKRALDPDSDSEFVVINDDPCPQIPDASLARPILSPVGVQRRNTLAVQHHQNIMKSSAMDTDDFEEAVFLRRREEVDADYVQMDCA
ncbi:hypothetical protein N7474_004718 [Penicillium riverlandense]|uniref:uncharacterized protein n=1 Tax=Penicillium riverlandense TaxID=1903569 RepID=UPI002547093C|nr:uncharacterized protein N7474_004718 [Penicillium riverlandense]KAJ5819127.1 hypothetical protein N7474_004718 [Penicillium riverlandense]